MSESIFRTQKPFEFAVRSDATASKNTDKTEEPSDQISHWTNELTRNDEYKVSKLNTIPAIINSQGGTFQAFTNQETKYACAAAAGGVYVWNYASVDSNPLTYWIEAPGSNGDNIICILVLPSPGSEEPGLVIVEKQTGEVKYFENISNDSIVYQKENVSSKISMNGGERVTIFENIEPVGIVIGTSDGRVVLVTLKDAAGKPCIKSKDIISTSFLPFFRRKYQIVSIRAGKNLGHGSRLLSILTDTGVHSEWNISRDGQAIKIFEATLQEALTNELKDLYEDKCFRILDSWPLENSNGSGLLVLGSVEISHTETCYVLFTIRKDSQELLVFSAYRLTRYTTPCTKAPKLFLPAPGLTTFVAFEDAVILVDAITKFDYSLIEKRKWEDVVSFRSGVTVIGIGYEDYLQESGHVVNLPALLIVTKESGIIKIERSNIDQKSESSFTKSHIEQAVFYGYDTNSPLSFQVPENLPLEENEIDRAIIEVSDELVKSTCAYLPPKLTSLEQHLELRLKKLENLVKYIATNFLNEMELDTKIRVISDLEKVNAARKVWPIFEESLVENNLELVAIFTEAISEVTGITKSNAKELIEDYFYYHVDTLGQLLSHVIEKVQRSNQLTVGVRLVLKAVKEGSIDISSSVRQGLFNLSQSEIGSHVPWIIEDDACFKYSELFEKYFDSVKDLSQEPSQQVTEVSNSLLSLSSVLFYSFSYALCWVTSKQLTKSTREQIQKYRSTYESSRGDWIRALIQFGQMNAALELADTFEDLYSLAEICQNEKERANANELSDVFIRSKFDEYFQKFGYRFAETLYNYYVFTGRSQDLMLEFPEYKDYLRRFLKSGNHGRISWIRDLLDGEYEDASDTLYTVASKADDLISNKKLQLSIAKLSVVASDQMNTEEILKDIDQGLTAIEIQEYLYREVVQFVKNDAASEVDTVWSSLTSNLEKRVGGSVLKNKLKRPFAKLLGNKSVGLNELIDLFTLLDLKTPAMNLNCYQALRLITAGLVSSPVQSISETLIWRRAILADDWNEINAIRNKPSYSATKIESLVLYLTLLDSFENDLFTSDSEIKLPDLKQLVQPLNPTDLKLRFHDISPDDANSLQQELQYEVDILNNYIQLFDLETLIKEIIGTAHKNSGSSTLVNYQTLEFA